MKLDDALAPEVSAQEFIEDCVPALFEARRELFATLSETAIIVSVWLTDTDKRYTIEFRPEGCTVEKGEMIDFPVVTLTGTEAQWDEVKRRALDIAHPLEARAHSHKPSQKITQRFLDDLERYDGKFVLELSGEQLDEKVEIGLILNDYVLPEGAPVLYVSTVFEVGEQLARAEITPAELDQKVRLRGDVTLGIDVGGLLLKYFPELEG